MFKNKPTATVEAEIATLDKRRASLEARRAKAAAASFNAVAARRVMLTELDDPDPAALDLADRAVRDAEDAKEGAADALQEVESRIADARDRLARLKATEERDRQAAAIEASATAADKAIDRIRKAAGELESARRDLASAILPKAVSCYAPPANAVEFGPQYLTTASFYDFHGDAHHDALDVEQVAARITGHIVSGALPGFGIARLEDVTKRHVGGGSTHVLAPVDGDVARSLLTDPMRVAAVRAREGVADVMPSAAPERADRRRADGWTTDREGRSFDKAGVRVTSGGFYVDDVEALLSTAPEVA